MLVLGFDGAAYQSVVLVLPPRVRSQPQIQRSIFLEENTILGLEGWVLPAKLTPNSKTKKVFVRKILSDDIVRLALDCCLWERQFIRRIVLLVARL